MAKCIIDEFKINGCAGCGNLCAYKIATEESQNNANLPKDYRENTLGNNPATAAQADIMASLKSYVTTFKRQFEVGGERIKSLYLYSNATGTGKTTTASVLLNEWIARSLLGAIKRNRPDHKSSAYFLDVNEWQSLYNKFNRGNVPQEVGEPASAEYYARLEKAKRADFTVLDDIGIRSATEPFRADLHEIINHRTTNELPTIYTSNVDIAELARVFDARLADRVRDQCLTITFSGESHRGVRR